jgi:hypothetical protein
VAEINTENTEKELVSLKKDLTEYYKNFHAQCETEETYYNQTYSFKVAEGYEDWISFPETPRVSIDNAATQVDTTNIRIDVPPRNSSTKAQVQAQNLRKGYLGFWHSIYRTQGLVLHSIAKHQFLYGMAVSKLVYDQDIWGMRPTIKQEEKYKDFLGRLDLWRDKNKARFPFRLINVNPKNILIDPSIAGPAYFIESYQRFARDIKVRWPEWDNTFNDNDLVDWVEYWDGEKVIYMCGEKVLYEAENTYGIPPYDMAVAGFGIDSISAKPEERWRGLLHPLHARITLEAQLETMIAAVLGTTAYPQKYFKGPEEYREQLIKAAQTWQAGPANNVLAIGDPDTVSSIEVKYVEPFRVAPEALSLLSLNSQRLQTSTVEPVLLGTRQEGVRAGYEVAMRAGLAKQKYGPALFSLEKMCERMGERFLRDIENTIQDKVTVWAWTPGEQVDQSISPKDIDGYYQHNLRLTSISPEEEDRLANLGRTLYQVGAISWYTLAMRYLHLENPYDELKQIMKEQLLKSPDIQKMLQGALMQTEDMEQQIEQMTGAQVAKFPNAGNMGIPPQSMPRPNEMQRTARPVMPGTVEEANLRAQQITQPGGYQGGRPMPPQLQV